MDEGERLTSLFIFDGLASELAVLWHRVVNEAEFESRDYRLEELQLGNTLSMGVWVSDPDHENPRSQVCPGEPPYEAVCGLLISFGAEGFRFHLTSDALNTAMDRYGNYVGPHTKLTDYTERREEKEEVFITALQQAARELGCWCPASR